MWRLLEVPERWQALRANPALIENAIEESLRYDPPVLAHFRTSLCPVAMHGHELPEHSKLMFNITGANRDPEKFLDPESFRLDRPLAEVRQHLSFGNGVHLCMGAPIARMEARIAMRLLLERLPRLRLLGRGERVRTWMYWGAPRCRWRGIDSATRDEAAGARDSGAGALVAAPPGLAAGQSGRDPRHAWRRADPTSRTPIRRRCSRTSAKASRRPS